MKAKFEEVFLWCMLPVTITAAVYNRVTKRQERTFLENEVQRLEYENHQLRTDLRCVNSALREIHHREMHRP